MRVIVINAKAIELDEEGYLVKPADWNEEVAMELAKQENLKMTETHWGLVTAVRDYYRENHAHPSGNALVHLLGKHLTDKPQEKRKAVNELLYELFPQGPEKQLAKIAGLPKLLPSHTEG